MTAAPKPGDHPDFFRLPPPPGRPRESSIRLDADGRFFHDGAIVEHGPMAAAFHTWIGRHPDDGRFILNNGYDWTYFHVDDAPYFVTSIHAAGDRLVLALSDGSEEAWDIASTRIGEDSALYAVVKREAAGGPYEAKLTRHAQASLAPFLVVADEGSGDACVAIAIGGKRVRIGEAR